MRGRAVLGAAAVALLARSAEAIESSSTSDRSAKFLVAWYDNQGQMFCQGSLITNQHVLTAASCWIDPTKGFSYIKNRDARAVAGVTSVNNALLPGSGASVIQIANVVTHPAFNPLNYYDHPGDLVDLAVVRLEDHVPMGEQHTADIVVLMSSATNHLLTFGNAPVNAFAFHGTNGQMSKASFTLSDSAMCESPNAPFWKTPRPETGVVPVADFNRNWHLCLAGAHNAGSLCAKAADEGSPLLFMNDQNWYQIGVFSHQWQERWTPNKNCANNGSYLGRDFFELYVRVSTFASWIQSRAGTVLPENYIVWKGGGPDSYAFSKATVQKVAGWKNNIGGLGEISTKLLSQPMQVCLTCGDQSPAKNCWCDISCKDHGDCCYNYDSLNCEKNQPPLTGTCRLKKSKELVCGYKSGDCWCDTKCIDNDDCCPDYVAECGVAGKNGVGTCLGKCGAKAGDCWCDASCAKNQDCCQDFHICSTVGAAPEQKSGSCWNNCGHNAGLCWCDPGCAATGDCCSDYDSQCGTPNSCAGHCGHEAMTLDTVKPACWCDKACREKGDCCPDRDRFCPMYQPTGR